MLIGADGQGIWINESRNIGFGHRRLSILDLSDVAKQPMPYLNERYWITLNGEIYNFLEIKDELKLKGFSFATESDTEVILAAYHEWGENCHHKFNGMWAFAIYDSLNKQFFSQGIGSGLNLYILQMRSSLFLHQKSRLFIKSWVIIILLMKLL